MKNDNLTEEAIRRAIEEVLDKDELTAHDIDTILKAASIQANLSRNEADKYKADIEREIAKIKADAEKDSAMFAKEAAAYTADKKLVGDEKRAKADKEAAKIKAEADEKAYRRQFWGNVITTVGTVGSTALSIIGVMAMFKSGLDFEQSGVITSQTMRNIMANGLKIIKK